MKLAITLLLTTAIAAAQSVRDELMAVTAGCDRVEIRLTLAESEEAGLTPSKVDLRGEGVAEFLSRVAFESDAKQDQPEFEEPELEEEVAIVTIPRPSNCRCSGSHELRFWKGPSLVLEMTYHHGTHLRSRRINGGKDVYLTPDSQSWLKGLIDFESDIQKLETWWRKREEANLTARQFGSFYGPSV